MFGKRRQLSIVVALIFTVGLLLGWATLTLENMGRAQAKEKAKATVDVNKIFPPSKPPEIREMVLQICTGCHNFVPIVIGRKTPEEWKGTVDRHRDFSLKPYGVTAKQEEAILKYLQENFNPKKPVPELPKELLDAWTNY